MNKITRVIFISLAGIFFAGASFIWWNAGSKLDTEAPCVFCNSQILNSQKFYEDSLVIGLCDYKPVEPGHCLAVVKRHIKNFDETTDEEVAAIGHLLKKINLVIQKTNGPSSYMILQKNGYEAGQTVPHVHVHYIPYKKTNSRSVPTLSLLWSFISKIFRRPIPKEKLAENVKLMRQEIEVIL